MTSPTSSDSPETWTMPHVQRKTLMGAMMDGPAPEDGEVYSQSEIVEMAVRLGIVRPVSDDGPKHAEWKTCQCGHTEAEHLSTWNSSYGRCPLCMKSGKVCSPDDDGGVWIRLKPDDVAALQRIARTRFCSEYDTFAAFCANCCGECGPCDDHATLRALIAQASETR